MADRATTVTLGRVSTPPSPTRPARRGPIEFLASADDRRRLVRCVIGLVCCGAGFASLVEAGLGLDPWDVFHQGVSDRVDLPIGTISILTGLVVLLCWIPLRERPGVGTILNVLIIGSTMDLLLPHLHEPADWWAQWAMLLGGIVVAGLGVGLYIGSGLGPGPRDGLMTGLARRGRTIRTARTMIELTALLVGWLLGGQVGIGTLVFAVAIGPIVHLTLGWFSLPPRSLLPAPPLPPSGGRPATDPVG